MELQDKLNELALFVGKEGNMFENKLKALLGEYVLEEDRNRIIDFIEDQFRQKGEKMDDFIIEANVKLQLSEVSKIISLSYIATEYFHKSRNWLYHKINGSVINGKPVRFTADEINTLNYALQDISRKIGATSIS